MASAAPFGARAKPPSHRLRGVSGTGSGVRLTLRLAGSNRAWYSRAGVLDWSPTGPSCAARMKVWSLAPAATKLNRPNGLGGLTVATVAPVTVLRMTASADG